MPTARRQMHLGVFVLGTGNHMAGWRHDGAFTTHMELPVMHAIGRLTPRQQAFAQSRPARGGTHPGLSGSPLSRIVRAYEAIDPRVLINDGPEDSPSAGPIAKPWHLLQALYRCFCNVFARIDTDILGTLVIVRLLV
jgi:hypothetical protein